MMRAETFAFVAIVFVCGTAAAAPLVTNAGNVIETYEHKCDFRE
jgi:hypothetical protein